MLPAPDVPLTVFPDKSVEVGGVIYKQVRNDKPRKAKDPCWQCVAFNNIRLCDVICPYCKDGFVFAEKRLTKK